MFKNMCGKGTKKGAIMEPQMELKWSLGRSRVFVFVIFGRLGRRSFFDAFFDRQTVGPKSQKSAKGGSQKRVAGIFDHFGGGPAE